MLVAAFQVVSRHHRHCPMGAFRLHPSGPPSSSRPRHQHIAQTAATFYYSFYHHLDHNQKVGYHKQTPDLQRIGTTSNHGRNTRGFSASPAPSTAGHPISSLPKAARRASTQDLEVCAAAGAHHYAAALHRLCQREGIPESKREGCVVVSVAVGRTPCHHEAPNLVRPLRGGAPKRLRGLWASTGMLRVTEDMAEEVPRPERS